MTNLIKNKKLTRITALLLAVAVIFGTMFSLPVSAASGDKVTITFDYCYDSAGNIIKFQQTTVSDGYTVGTVGEELCKIFADGKEAYCIEPGHTLYSGNTLTESASTVWKNLGSAKQKAINIALLYGKPGSEKSLSGTEDQKWVATQLIVWEFVSGCRSTADGYKCTNTKFIDGICAGGANPGVKSVYNAISKSLANYSIVPSFASAIASKAETYEMKYSDGKYTLTLTDSNNILSSFSFKTTGGVSASVSGNKLTLTSTSPVNDAVTFNSAKSMPSVGNTTLVPYGDASLQDVITGVENDADPIRAYFKVKTSSGNLKLVKTAEDGNVANIEFTVKGDGYSKTAKTNSKGEFELTDLVPGKYTVTEHTPTEYAEQKSKTVNVESGKTATVSFSNVLKKWKLTVTKTDAETKSAQGDATLAGAVYGIYNNGKLVDKYTTDKNGSFTTSYYICGDNWTLKEIDPSEGYLLDETEYHIGAEAKKYTLENNSVSMGVTEDILKGKIAIIKHTDDGSTKIETPEKGAEFQVYLKSAGSYNKAKETERDTLVCDEYGFAETKDLPYGTYTVHQTKGWNGTEFIADFDVFISENNKTYKYLINNASLESYVKIVKVDSETGKQIPYAGAGFQLYDPNGNLITMTFTYPEVTTIDTFYTTADGYLITPQTLEYGKGYSLVEVQAPYGYVLNSEPVYFDVMQENSEIDSGITVIEVVRSNVAQKGTITVSKSGEVFSSVNEAGGLYQPVYAVRGLEGAVYGITAAEDIYTLDGTLRASKGEVVDTVTTGADGTAVSKELYLGKYEVKEITAPFGMVLNEEIHAVELVYAGQNVAVTETAASFYNERQRVEIDLIKRLMADEAYGIGKNGENFDVTFGLYAEKKLTAADGTVIPADGLIEIISLDGNGSGKVKTDLPIGSYYVKELATNSAYILNGQKYPVVFEYAGQKTATVHITANGGEAIENDIIYGSVSGKKSDEDGNALGGAVIGIFKTGTEKFTTENAIQTTVTAADGSFSFEKVPYGTWVIREIESPTGFVLSEEKITVTIGAVDEVVEIELVNYFIRGNIELTKVDKDYPDNKLTGAEFEVFADTNGDVKLDNDDKLLGTMTELDGGVYQMKELRYGKYLVREKTAPTGFVLDENVYSVSIEGNGKTYIVENEADVGFVNAAQKGSLKIVKTSSDGKIEGFSFRVTGADGYDQTFKTDKNGEIFIEGLRIGEYTISEVNNSVSAGYILPADKQATVKVGATTIVEMHNELRDTPKTGDDFNLALWVSLAAASVLGAGVLGVAGFKKKKKED